MQSLPDIAAMQDQLTTSWHREALEVWHPTVDPWISLVCRQHLANFELWHTEDAARTPDATDGELARVKRRIDEANQRRNDLSEQIDQFLLAILAVDGLPNTQASLHSESPGLMIDRLSILSLKIFHTREELERPLAPEGHVARNTERLDILQEQRGDLATCLHDLWSDTLAGRRRFKLYRQLKMYNDPALNPAMYENRVVRQ